MDGGLWTMDHGLKSGLDNSMRIDYNKPEMEVQGEKGFYMPNMVMR